MIAHYRELLTKVHRRPGMFGVDDAFASHVTFLVGLDAGTGHLLLSGFKEFLQAKIGQESSLWFPGLVLWLTEPVGHKNHGHRDLPVDVNDAVVARWYELLDEFLDLRQDWHGLTQIYGEYLGMLKRRGISYGHKGAERLGAALDAVGGVNVEFTTNQDRNTSQNNLGEGDHEERGR